MRFGEAVRTCFRRYADSRGRAPRAEYWWWHAFFYLVYVGGSVVMVAITLGAAAVTDDKAAGGPGAMAGGIALIVLQLGLMLFYLAVVVPSLAVTVRRLHDIDRSGWWHLIVFTGIGGIVLLVWFCTRGTAGANRFGLESDADIAGVFGSDGAKAALPGGGA